MSTNAVLKFSSSRITEDNHVGMKPDKDGFYKQIIIGCFDVFNCSNEWYPFHKVKSLFKEDGDLMEKVNMGYLKGEYGHPRIEPGETEESFMMRAAIVDEKNISHQFRDLTVTPEKRNGKTIYVVRADVRCMGPYGDVLRDSMENKYDNVAFSIRGLTEDVYRGLQLERSFVEIFTWDAVNQPGKHQANQLDSKSAINMQSNTDIIIPVGAIVTMGDQLTPAGLSMQNSGINMDKLLSRLHSSHTRGIDSRTW